MRTSRHITRSTALAASALLSVAIAGACASPNHTPAATSAPPATTAEAGAPQPGTGGFSVVPSADGAAAAPASAAAPGSAEVLPVVVSQGTVSPVATTETVPEGEVATATFQTRPGRSCELVVQYAGGGRPPQRFEPIVADSSGIVSWTWRLSSGTPLGNATASVVCSGDERGEVKLTVVK